MDIHNPAPPPASSQPLDPPIKREDDAIYQDGRLAGRVLGPEIDANAKEIRFGEIYNSDYLLLPEDCEYQRYRLLVRKIGYASKLEKDTAHKGRILRDVVAEILGYREQ